MNQFKQIDSITNFDFRGNQETIKEIGSQCSQRYYHQALNRIDLKKNSLQSCRSHTNFINQPGTSSPYKIKLQFNGMAN